MSKVKIDRRLKVAPEEGTAEDLMPHLLRVVAASLKRPPGLFHGARAERGFCVFSADHDDAEFMVIAGFEGEGRTIGLRVAAEMTGPRQAAAIGFICGMVLSTFGMFAAGVFLRQPLLSFVGIALVSLALGGLAWAVSGAITRARAPKLHAEVHAAAERIFGDVAGRFAKAGVEVVSAPVRIIGMDVSAHSVRSGSTVDAGRIVRWTSLMNSTIASVPPD